MITKIMLMPDDLTAMFQSILEYNRRGKLVSFAFFDAEQKPVNTIAYMEVYTEESGGLAVRAKPEEDPQQSVRNMVAPDPRSIIQPLTIEEAQRLAGE